MLTKMLSKLLFGILITHITFAQESSKPLRFILLTPFAEYSFFQPIKKGMTDAARSLGVEAVFSGTSDGNTVALAEKVRHAAKQGYDGIALNIVDSTALRNAISETIKDGIPIIAFNVDDTHTPNARLAAIGQNMIQAGRTFGKAVEQFIPQGSHVLVTMHDTNISALADRVTGMQEILKFKNITWKRLITGTEPDAAVEIIRSTLESDPSIKIILSTGSADTEAAGTVLERYFHDRGYSAAGFDLSPEILRLIKAHHIRLSVDQQPYVQGYYAIVELAFYRRYGLKPSNIDTGANVINSENADKVIELSQQHYR